MPYSLSLSFPFKIYTACCTHIKDVLFLSRVLVGAPKANSTYSSSVHSPGAVYKCRVHSNPERRCTEMDLGRGQSPTNPLNINTQVYIITRCSSRTPHAPTSFRNEHLSHPKVHCPSAVVSSYTNSLKLWSSCRFFLSTLCKNSPNICFVLSE